MFEQHTVEESPVRQVNIGQQAAIAIAWRVVESQRDRLPLDVVDVELFCFAINLSLPRCGNALSLQKCVAR